MGGFTRLKIVLSAIYWMIVGLGVFVINQSNIEATQFPPSWQLPIWPLLVGGAVLYGAVAAIWWAFAGFRRAQ